MSDLEPEEEYVVEIYDLHQDRPTQDTSPGGSPVRQTRATSYSRGTGKGKIKQRGKDPECSEDEQATLPIIKKPIYSLPLWLYLRTTRRCVKTTPPSRLPSPTLPPSA